PDGRTPDSSASARARAAVPVAAAARCSAHRPPRGSGGPAVAAGPGRGAVAACRRAGQSLGGRARVVRARAGRAGCVCGPPPRRGTA
ncbi:AAA ATPase, partial [Mycobacterium sp. PO1]